MIKTIVDYSDEILDEAQRLENEGIEYHKAFKAALKCYVDYLSDSVCTDQSYTEY